MRLFQAWHDRPIEKLLSGQSHRLTNIEQELKRMTTAIDDLNQAIVNLGAAVNGATAEIANHTAQLIAANSANDSVAVEAAAKKITDVAASLNAAVAAAQPAPPAPAPAPEPAPAPAPASTDPAAPAA
jgi:septal ring factor EnvC (AmiA/AmiB activator)